MHRDNWALTACASDREEAQAEAADTGTQQANDDASSLPTSQTLPAEVGASEAGAQPAATDPGSPSEWPIPAVGPAIPRTSHDHLPISAEGLRPARAYDYLAVRRRFGPGGLFAATAGNDYHVVSETGRPCATATQPQCAQVMAGDPVAGFVQTDCTNACFEESIVSTRGDEVQRWIGADQAKELLGEIDSPDDALWLARAAGYEVTCGDANLTSVRAAADGAAKLDGPALARVAAAKARAVRGLVREAAQPVAEELQRAAGLPSVAVASALVGELTHSLWAPDSDAPKAA